MCTWFCFQASWMWFNCFVLQMQSLRGYAQCSSKGFQCVTNCYEQLATLCQTTSWLFLTECLRQGINLASAMKTAIPHFCPLCPGFTFVRMFWSSEYLQEGKTTESNGHVNWSKWMSCQLFRLFSCCFGPEILLILSSGCCCVSHCHVVLHLVQSLLQSDSFVTKSTSGFCMQKLRGFVLFCSWLFYSSWSTHRESVVVWLWALIEIWSSLEIFYGLKRFMQCQNWSPKLRLSVVFFTVEYCFRKVGFSMKVLVQISKDFLKIVLYHLVSFHFKLQ